MRSYLRILSFGRPYKADIPVYFFFAFMAIVFGLLNYTLLIPLLEVLFNSSGRVQEQVVTQPEFEFSLNYMLELFNFHFSRVLSSYGKQSALLFICSIILCTVAISNISRYIAQRTMGNVKARVIRNMRRAIYHRVTQLELGFFSNERKGDIMQRVTGDIQEVEISVVDTFNSVFRDPIMIISYFVTLFLISTELTKFVIIYLPLSALVIAELIKRVKKSAVLSQSALANILGIVDETMNGIRIIKAFVAEKTMTDRFDKENDNYANLYRTMAHKREFASPLSEFLGVLLVTGMLLYGGMLILKEDSDLSSAGFIPYIFILVQIMMPIKSISNAISNIQRGLAAGGRVFEILDRGVQIRESENAVELNDFQECIEYRNVTFAYDKEPVLKNVNLRIEKGKTIALVGPSGGGKSTLADLLPRFYDVLHGEILIDGVPIKDCTFASLRSKMGIVTQESILFNDSIINNIAFGCPSATIEEVQRAARIANAHDFIVNCEHGYDTVIGERGSKLSGGQRQRISIARAVLRNPPILILDEATSALDNESEKLVQDALMNLMKNRTAIIIAHRLSTIQHADEIVVIEKGNVIQRGKHQDLMEADGLYKKLHSTYME